VKYFSIGAVATVVDTVEEGKLGASFAVEVYLMKLLLSRPPYWRQGFSSLKEMRFPQNGQIG